MFTWINQSILGYRKSRANLMSTQKHFIQNGQKTTLSAPQTSILPAYFNTIIQISCCILQYAVVCGALYQNYFYPKHITPFYTFMHFIRLCVLAPIRLFARTHPILWDMGYKWLLGRTFSSLGVRMALDQT